MQTAIRKAREERGWSQEQLAYRSGLSAKTIQKLEAGEDTRVSTLRKIADALGVAVDSLLPDPEVEAV
ncbi:MAG: helix-turn-helix domain-containing protein [Actinomycetota bacterium]